MKAWACICTIVIVLTFTGCAVHMNHDSNKEASQTQIWLSDPKTKIERTTDFSEPVKVSELDYDSLQSQMTDEEWEGFQQYFPVLRENTAFHYTSFEDREALNRNGEPIKEGEYVLFARYTSAEIMDLAHFVKGFADNDIAEMMIEEIRVFDLDGDGIQELIMQWTPVGDILVLHHEKEEFYGWKIMYRGFESLQTNGIYIGSGGAGSNSWMHIRFDNGSWLEEILFEEDWGNYYVNGKPVAEDTFLQQVTIHETECVIGYKPRKRVNKITKQYPPS